MAKNTIVEIVDDLDGSKDATEIAFSFQGTDYNIDLGAKNLAAFEKMLEPYLRAATKDTAKSTSRPARRSSKSKSRDLGAIRDWARAHGIEVSDRGRVASTVVDQYEIAHEGR